MLRRILKKHPRLLACTRALRPRTWRDARGLASVRNYLRLLAVMESAAESPGPPVVLRLRQLGDTPLAVRPGTTDVWVLTGVLGASPHRPPADLDPAVIWDLGCNIGLTLADFALAFPHARLVGVEPDPSSAALARRNTVRWATRCQIVQAAVWHADGELAFDSRPGWEWGARLNPDGATTVQTFALNTLLSDEQSVDYLKMDIEGAERAVLTHNTGWASKVTCIRVETHAPYTREECAGDLERLGFVVTLDEGEGSRHLTGVRPSIMP